MLYKKAMQMISVGVLLGCSFLFVKHMYTTEIFAVERISTFQSADKRVALKSLYLQRYEDANMRRNKARFKILFIGDSITRGYYAMTVLNRFAAIVNAKVGDGPAEEISAANIRLTELDTKIGEKTFGSCDLAIIQLGTNDYKKTPISEFRERYFGLIKYLRNKGILQIICIGVWRENDSYLLDQAIFEIAQKTNAEFIYIGDLYYKKRNHNAEGLTTVYGKSDWFHPSDLGHAEIARRVINAVEEMGKKQDIYRTMNESQ